MTDTTAASSAAPLVARRKTFTERFDPVLVPLVSGTLAALFSQVATLQPSLTTAMRTFLGLDDVALWWLIPALFIGLSLEFGGIAFMRYAHLARLDDDSPLVYRLGTWAVTLTAATINWLHWTPAWNRPTLLGVVFAGLSIFSVAGWELREHRMDRHRRREALKASGWTREVIPPRPEFGAVRWLRYPGETFAAWSLAVQYRIPTSAASLERAQQERARRVGPWTRFVAWLHFTSYAVALGPAQLAGVAVPRPDRAPVVEAGPGAPVKVDPEAGPVEPGPGAPVAVEPGPARTRARSPRRPQAPAPVAVEAGPGAPVKVDPEVEGPGPDALVDRAPVAVEADAEQTLQFPPVPADEGPEIGDEVFAALVRTGVDVAKALETKGVNVNRETLLPALRAHEVNGQKITIPRAWRNHIWPAVRTELAHA